MRKEVMIGDKKVELLANAATPYRFRSIFHRDLLTLLSETQASPLSSVDIITQLAFTMMKQAEGADMTKIKEDDFIAWLEGIESDVFWDQNVLVEILSVYNKNAVVSVKAKKKTQN